MARNWRMSHRTMDLMAAALASMYADTYPEDLTLNIEKGMTVDLVALEESPIWEELSNDLAQVYPDEDRAHALHQLIHIEIDAIVSRAKARNRQNPIGQLPPPPEPCEGEIGFQVPYRPTSDIAANPDAADFD